MLVYIVGVLIASFVAGLVSAKYLINNPEWEIEAVWGAHLALILGVLLWPLTLGLIIASAPFSLGIYIIKHHGK